MQDLMQPLELKITAARSALSITWTDGTRAVILASRLRALSQAAPHVRAGIDGQGTVVGDLRIEAAELIGVYAVRFTFSDGHDRGIYPWRYLREIADQTDAVVPDTDPAGRRRLHA